MERENYGITKAIRLCASEVAHTFRHLVLVGCPGDEEEMVWPSISDCEQSQVAWTRGMGRHEMQQFLWRTENAGLSMFTAARFYVCQGTDRESLPVVYESYMSVRQGQSRKNGSVDHISSIDSPMNVLAQEERISHVLEVCRMNVFLNIGEPLYYDCFLSSW